MTTMSEYPPAASGDDSLRALGSVSDTLWQGSAGVYRAILTHPFLSELASGTLARSAFVRYLAQDSIYLRSYAQALRTLSDRASDVATTRLFAHHAEGALVAEQDLHAGLLAELGGVGVDQASPTTQAYTDFLLARTHRESFSQAMAAVLPCYWIYWRVGQTLARIGSPDPLYQRWIDTYGGEDFGAITGEVLEVVDASIPDPDELAAMMRVYRTAARYEWMFWDAAWKGHGWAV